MNLMKRVKTPSDLEAKHAFPLRGPCRWSFVAANYCEKKRNKNGDYDDHVDFLLCDKRIQKK